MNDRASIGAGDLSIGGRPIELRLIALSPQMLRITIAPIGARGEAEPLPPAPELIVDGAGETIAATRALAGERTLAWGNNRVRISDPPAISVTDADGRTCQDLRILPDGAIDFALGHGPLFGLGQGGRQFDRRGGLFERVNGQGEGVQSIDMNAPGARAPEYAFDLAGEGARITIPWIISADGWAFYFRLPVGTFDLTGARGRLIPERAGAFDVFLIVSRDPAMIMWQQALLTGLSHLPPLWSLGYMQSHRTLVSRDAVLAEAAEFRRRKLPCDAMIYLGTGFCSDGWNTGHDSFGFNPRIFPDPEAMLRQLHDDGMRVVVHVVDPPLHLHGAVGESSANPDHVAGYWARHAPALETGIDGWWPDVGDKLEIEARLARIRMYWDGAIADHPDRRPFALHRNACAGVQRYGWLWSGDIDSAWRTLAMQVSVGLNCGLTGIALWGTDTGGFITTPELTGELYVRWFQYSAFCPLFRSHGRTWKLRLPWGWNTGDFGPEEYDFRRVALPDRSELHNAAVEPICRKYLELRYRLLPYTYSAVREASDTGMPVMRALWLHYPSDPDAVACGDVYLWGRDILVAPVTEKGATQRALYLPPGEWWDFWSGERVAGGRQVTRAVDLATLPLYVRSGAIIATGPVKQHTGEISDEPLRLTIYPGQDGAATLYEDDGASLDHLRGDWQAFRFTWSDRTRRLALSLLPGSKAMTRRRDFIVACHGTERTTTLTFNGDPTEIAL
jgi:alpha-glucosidase (family GH31 glycosyl hydrolase)